MRHALIVAVFLAVSTPTLAQEGQRSLMQNQPLPQMLGFCVEPEEPLMDDMSLEILEMSRGEELARYMNEVQAYSHCLGETQNQIARKVKAYLDEYQKTMH